MKIDKIKNVVNIQLICADLNMLVQELISAGIILDNIQYIDEITICFKTSIKHYKRLIEIVDNKKAEVISVDFLGFNLIKRSIKRRYVLCLGLILYCVLSLIISGRIFFIQVSGNDQVRAEEILQVVESNGLYFGAKRKKVNNESIKNALIAQLPELQWVGINTAGCVATINVTDRSNEMKKEENNEPSCVVANNEGIIRSTIVVKGTAMCKNGQAVSKGDILISGQSEIGGIIVISDAEGEVYADTNHELVVVGAKKSVQRTRMIDSERRAGIIFGKKLINFYGDSGILDSSCVKMYWEEFIRLPGGFYLPLKLYVEQVDQFETSDFSGAVFDWLVDAGKNYILSHSVSGSIITCEYMNSLTDSAVVCHMKCICNEMIGVNKKEEIFVFDG